MSPIFSAIMTSCLLIMFTSFLSTKIDQTVKWNWFLVFLPAYMLQTFYLVDVIIIISKKQAKFKLLNLLTCFFCIILIFLFEILLCVKLEYSKDFKLVFVFIPIWIIFLVVIAYLLTRIFKK